MESQASAPHITRIILFVKDIPTVAAFYERFFNMQPLKEQPAHGLSLHLPQEDAPLLSIRYTDLQKATAA